MKKKTLNKILLIIGLMTIYQIAYFIFPIKDYLPSIFQIIQSFFTSLASVSIYNDIFSSLLKVTIGFLLASVFGIFLGLFLAYDKRFREIKFIIDILRPIPPIAWIPIAIIIFGLGNFSAYFIVFLGSFFPIFTNTYFGAESIPQIYKNVSQSFEIGSVKYFTKVLFFYSLPSIFTGLKIGIGMAWMSVIAAELIDANSGLGYFIQQNRLLLQTDNVIVGMILIGITGFLLLKFIEFLEKKIIVWI